MHYHRPTNHLPDFDSIVDEPKLCSAISSSLYISQLALRNLQCTVAVSINKISVSALCIKYPTAMHVVLWIYTESVLQTTWHITFCITSWWNQLGSKTKDKKILSTKYARWTHNKIILPDVWLYISHICYCFTILRLWCAVPWMPHPLTLRWTASSLLIWPFVCRSVQIYLILVVIFGLYRSFDRHNPSVNLF